jgi:hypothetical protein
MNLDFAISIRTGADVGDQATAMIAIIKENRP